MPTRFALLTLLVVMVPVASQIVQADDVPSVLHDWEKRRGAARTVRYTIKWELFPSGLRPGDPKPGTNGLYTGTSQLLLNFEKGRYRYDRDGVFRSAGTTLVRELRTHRYDGREEYTALDIISLSAIRPIEPTHANIGPWTSAFTEFREVAPPLWGHGIHWTHQDSDAERFPLSLTRQPDRYTITRREVIERRPHVVLQDSAARPGTIHTLHCEPARGGAVVRERIEDARSVSELTVSYRDTPAGWFAEQWTFHDGAPGEPLRESSRYQVELFELNPTVTDGDFRIVLRPGMGVTKDGRPYRAAADGTLTPVVADNPQSDPLGQLDERTKWIGGALFGLVVLLIVLFLWLRHRRIKRGIEWS